MATWSLRLRAVWRRAPGLSSEFGHPPFDGGMDVLIRRKELEGPGEQFGLNLLESHSHELAVLGRHEPCPNQASDMGPRAAHVVRAKTPIERQAHRVRHQRLSGTPLKSAVPQR